MKQQTITTDKATLLLAELPEGAEVENELFVINRDKHIRWWKNGKDYLMDIYDEGNWQLLGRLPDITEIQASELVDSYEVSHNLDLGVTLTFKDYNNGISEDENVDYDYWDEYPFDTAIQSLSSLLQANEVYFDNPLGKEHPIRRKGQSQYGLYDDAICWSHAQSKVWDKERTYLFIKVD